MPDIAVASSCTFPLCYLLSDSNRTSPLKLIIYYWKWRLEGWWRCIEHTILQTIFSVLLVTTQEILKGSWRDILYILSLCR